MQLHASRFTLQAKSQKPKAEYSSAPQVILHIDIHGKK
jgi:hypothetical protein